LLPRQRESVLIPTDQFFGPKKIPKKQLSIYFNVVLPVRIELTTSSLPMKCSTTELRQRRDALCRRARLNWGDPCHKGRGGASSRPKLAAGRLAGAPQATILWGMAKTDHESRKAERLRTALRENLKRRKAQAKGRSAPAAAKQPSTPAHDSAGIGVDKQNG
jgi:hypothetical protein